MFAVTTPPVALRPMPRYPRLVAHSENKPNFLCNYRLQGSIGLEIGHAKLEHAGRIGMVFVTNSSLEFLKVAIEPNVILPVI